MTTKIQRWGNSLALRIPKSFAEDVHLASGDAVSLTIAHGRLVIESCSKDKYSLSDLLKKVSKNNLHHEVRSNQVLGNEIW